MDKKEYDLVAELQAKEAAFAVKKIKVMTDVEGILKTGENKVQGYTYAAEAEVVKHIRKAFITNNLSYAVECGRPEISHVIPTRSGEMKHFIVPLVCSLTDAETGLTKSYPWYGGAADTGDKALYKAYTSGSKYFLMKTFLLPTGDDVEAFADVDQPPKNEPVKPQAKTVAKPVDKTVDKAVEKPNVKAAASALRKDLRELGPAEENIPLPAKRPEPSPESIEILRNVFTAFLINKQEELIAGFDWDFEMLKDAVFAKYSKWPTNPNSVKKIVADISPVDIMKDVSQI